MGHTPLGYRIEKGKAVIDEEAAAKVRQLYKNYLGDLSLTNVAKETDIKALHAGAKRIMQNEHYQNGILNREYPVQSLLDQTRKFYIHHKSLQSGETLATLLEVAL